MNEDLSSTIIESPFGPLMCVADGAGIVSLRPQSADPEAAPSRRTRLLEQARTELREYFDGSRTRFDVALAARGTQFQRAVWDALLRIPCGETRSYGEIAKGLGAPSASRAVGAANGQNPVMIIVPCHRVIGANRSLTGYAWGLEMKAWLLAHENRPTQTSALRVAPNPS